MEFVLKYIYDILGNKAWAKVVGLLAVLSIVVHKIVSLMIQREEVSIKNEETVMNRMSHLHDRIDQQWNMLDDLQSKVDHWRKKYMDLEQKVQSLKSDNQRLKQKLHEKSEIIEGLQEKEIEYRNRIDKLES